MKLQRQIDQLLALRASQWHQIMENPTEAQRAEFVAWLKQSPLHVQEYLETTYTDRVLQRIDPQRRQDIDLLLAQAAPKVAQLQSARVLSPALPESKHRQRRRWLGAVGIAASALLCALALPLAYRLLVAPPEYTTTIGEQRTVELADSSVITMNADSRVQVHLSDTHRDIQLLHGEALFNVAHDPHRPFTVRTHTAIVRAVGTQFNVYERPNGTLVSVLEGKVAITSQPRNNTENLTANQEALIKPNGMILLMSKADVTKTIAWRERRLIFEDALLEDMVYEFNRYNRTTHVRIDGVPPGSHHFNGIFDAGDLESLADLLSKEPDLIVEKRDGEIVIRKR